MRAFLLDRILCGQHEERPIEREADAADRHLVLLHGFEQRRLRLRRRAIDFVGQNDVGENRSANEPDRALPRRAIFFEHFRTQDVRRHQIRCELDAIELQVDRLGQLADQQRLREPGHATQKAVASGENAIRISRTTVR